MKHSFPTLYLFNNVFFPQTVIPLTVNDPASIKLLETSYQKDIQVAFYHPSNRVKKIATIGKIILLEYNPDKSLTALVQGLLRVKLVNEVQQIPHPVYTTEVYQDINDQIEVVHNSVERLQNILEHWLNRHISSPREKEKFIKDLDSPFKLVNNLCLFLIKDIELKDILLESTSLAERIRLMDALLKGKSPDIEDIGICEAIKDFEHFDSQSYNKQAV
jgi:ATP-dependent Lon protease